MKILFRRIKIKHMLPKASNLVDTAYSKSNVLLDLANDNKLKVKVYNRFVWFFVSMFVKVKKPIAIFRYNNKTGRFTIKLKNFEYDKLKRHLVHELCHIVQVIDDVEKFNSSYDEYTYEENPNEIEAIRAEYIAYHF